MKLLSIILTEQRQSPPNSPETSRKKLPFKIPYRPKKKTERSKQDHHRHHPPDRQISSSAEDDNPRGQRNIHHDIPEKPKRGSPVHRQENGTTKIQDTLHQELNSCLHNSSLPAVQTSSESGGDSGGSGQSVRVALRPPIRNGQKANLRKDREQKKSADEALVEEHDAPFPIPRTSSSPTLDRKPKRTEALPEVKEEWTTGRQALKPPPKLDFRHREANQQLENSKEQLSKTKSLPFTKKIVVPPPTSPLLSPELESPTGTLPNYGTKTKDKVRLPRPSVPPPAPPVDRVTSPTRDCSSGSSPSPQSSPSKSSLLSSTKPAPVSGKPQIIGPKPVLSPKPDLTSPKFQLPTPPKPQKRTSIYKPISVQAEPQNTNGQVSKGSILHLSETLSSKATSIFDNRDFSRCSDLCAELEVFYSTCIKYLESLPLRARVKVKNPLSTLDTHVQDLKMKTTTGSDDQLVAILGDVQKQIEEIRTLIQR